MTLPTTDLANPAGSGDQVEIPDILDAISRASVGSLGRLKTAFKEQALRRAVAMLERAASIRIIYAADAFPAAALLRTGLNEQARVCVMPPSSAAPAVAEDLLIVIGRFGDDRGGREASRLHAALVEAKTREIPILAISESRLCWSEETGSGGATEEVCHLRLPRSKSRPFGARPLADQIALAQSLLIALERLRNGAY